MATANTILKKAISQLGVMEKPAGSNNVKYNTYYYGHAVHGSAYAWCAVFLYWCFAQSKSDLFPKNANAAYAQDEIVSRKGGKWVMKKTSSLSTRKSYLKKAQKGDIVCFDFGKYNCYRQHIGIVEKVSGNYIYCIEGNTSPDERGSQSNGGRVCRKARHYSMICSAARPNYSVPKSTATTKTTTAGTTAKTETKKKTSRAKIFTTPGHSPTDPGATSKWGVEYDLNCKVVTALNKYLKEMGYDVKTNPKSVKKLEKITSMANEWKADLYVSVHYNAGGGDGWEGCLYSLDASHKKLGQCFERRVKAVGQNSRGLKKRPDLKNLSLTDMPAILNEIAFIDNYKDIKDWRTDAQIDKMAKALALACADYLG